MTSVLDMKTQRPTRLALALFLVFGLGACSSIENLLAGDKIDYRSSASNQTKGLEVPPDLTQLARENRYQLPGGVVSAAATSGGTTVSASNVATVAPLAVGEIRVERAGTQRWLFVPLPPERLWPQLRAFWQERGFTLTSDSSETGVMETDWAENRAKLPQDFIRQALGRIFDSFYSTSERDRFRTRVERVAGGSEVYISHRGLEEVYGSQSKDSTIWQPRKADPQLEAEFLSRLMVRLGAKDEVARTVVAAAPEAPAKARLLASAAALEVDEPFDRTWRRLGLALDRTGFTVEDRDRSAGTYFVRYVDPKETEKGEPNFFAKLFSNSTPAGPVKYRVSVKSEGNKSTISVLNSAGAADSSDNAKRIAGQLVTELR